MNKPDIINCKRSETAKLWKNGTALKSLVEIKVGGQEMIVMMLMLINFNNDCGVIGKIYYH